MGTTGSGTGSVSSSSAATTPTLTSITTEGIKKAGHSSPTAAQLTRAQDEWMEEIKADIFNYVKNLRCLMTDDVIILAEGQTEYQFPSDFSSIIGATLLHGVNTGTLQAGDTETVTLAADEDVTDGFIVGKDILITSGTAEGLMTKCVAYDEDTKVATVEPDFTSSPGAAGYMIVDERHALRVDAIFEEPYMVYPENRKPVGIYIEGDDLYDRLHVYPPPDDTYGLHVRYYADLLSVGLDSALMERLYKRWRNVFISGVKWKQMEYDDDERARIAMDEYNNYIRMMVGRERYGLADMSELQIRVADY